MKVFPTKGGWLRLGVFVAASAVMLIPVHVDSQLRGSIPVPVSFDSLHSEHGAWGVAGVITASADGTVPFGNKLLSQVPEVNLKLAQIHGWLFSDEAEDAGAASGDIRYANLVSDYIAAGEVRAVLGGDPGPTGSFVTNTPTNCAWFQQGLREKDVVVSADGQNMEVFRANAALSSGRSPQTVTVRRGEQTFTLTFTLPCEQMPLVVDVYAQQPPVSTTNGSSGSSRGLIVGLAMLDSTTDGDLTGGKKITGTGGLLVGGKTENIEGVTQKVDGADGHYGVFMVDSADYPAARAEAQRLRSTMQIVDVPDFPAAVTWLCAHGGQSDAACSTRRNA